MQSGCYLFSGCVLTFFDHNRMVTNRNTNHHSKQIEHCKLKLRITNGKIANRTLARSHDIKGSNLYKHKYKMAICHSIFPRYRNYMWQQNDSSPLTFAPGCKQG